MAARRNILVLDAGTTGVKGFVFDAQLQPLAKAYAPLRRVSRRSGWVEQDPREILRASVKVLREAVRTSDVARGSLGAFALTNQRETVVAWDRRTGVPAHPAIVWEDRRTAGRCRRLRRHGAEVRRRTGLPLDPYFSATKMQWILENVPRAERLAASGDLLFGTVDSWLLWSMLEGRPHVTDRTNASRTLLFNIRTLEWDGRLLRLFKVPEVALPRVLSSAGRFGMLRKDIVGRSLPALAVCGDQQASLFAAGRARGTTKVTYGTGAFTGQVAGSRFVSREPFFTTLAAWPRRRPFYALEAKVEHTGRDVQRTLKNPAALRRVVTRIARAVAAHLRRLPVRPREVVMDGGITRDGDLVAMQARAARVRVRQQKIYDGTALGAAMLARAAMPGTRRASRDAGRSSRREKRS